MKRATLVGSISERLLLIISSLLLLLHVHDVQAQTVSQFNCLNTSRYTYGDQFQTNLNLLLRTLASNGSEQGFLNTTVGAAPDIVYGLVQCRGNISKADCQTCLDRTSIEIIQKCPDLMEAVLRYDDCILHYSNNNFFSVVDNTSRAEINTANVPAADADRFLQQLGSLLTNLSQTAAEAPLKIGYGIANYSASGSIYGLAQCTRDLSPLGCRSCLRSMISYTGSCCSSTIGAKVFSTTCNLRFETSLFFADQFLQEDADGTGKRKSNKTVAIVVPTIASVLLLAVIAYVTSRKIRNNRKKATAEIIYDEDDITGEESSHFDLKTIRNATNDFSNANKLGEGGFGAVYKGELNDGQKIAVKRLSKNSGQGSREFKNEVVLLTKLQHRNLVRLLGFCLADEEKLLIYQYVPNRSLDQYIFDPTRKLVLDWKRRYNIISGIAKGLLYLHEDSRLKIIHRDLKAGNILLDDEMNAKIADFGMAKLFRVDQTEDNTNRIAGTFGYMAPEYALHGLSSVKSDVYSFGVLLLEIVSGQKTNSFHLTVPATDLRSYAWKLWKEDNALQLMDPILEESFSGNEVLRCIHIGLLCAQDNIEKRPSMSSVVLMLNNDSLTLDSPTEPAFGIETIIGINESSNAEFDSTSNSLLAYAVGVSSMSTNPR